MWAKTEPVRLYLYSLLVPVAAVLVAYGLIESTFVPLFIAAGAALLGVPLIEAARSKVTSPATLAAMTPGDSPDVPSL